MLSINSTRYLRLKNEAALNIKATLNGLFVLIYCVIVLMN